jgi:peptidoglycan/LPS O-acetylase OafA/YrhL
LGVPTAPEVLLRPGSRIREVDGLRGAAILLVLLWHHVAILVQVPHGTMASHLLGLFRLSWSGVDLFFVISGFLIGGILIDERSSPNYLSTFYRRRFFRIVPLYAVVCTLFWAGVLLGGSSWRGRVGQELFANPPPWYSFPLFLQNAFIAFRGTFEPLPIGVTWSLAVEEQFYLTLPLLVRTLSRRRLIQVLIGFALAAPLLRTLAFFGSAHGGVAAYVLMPMRADALLAGVFAAMLVRSPQGRSLLEHRRGAFAAAALVLAGGALAMMLLGHSEDHSPVMSTVGYSWLAAFYAVSLLLAVSSPSSLFARILRARWLRGMGDIAYGTYLLHVAVLHLCFALVLGSTPRIRDRSELLVMLLSAILTVAIARLSWTQFEAKMIALGRRRVYRPARDRAPAAATLGLDL